MCKSLKTKHRESGGGQEEIISWHIKLFLRENIISNDLQNRQNFNYLIKFKENQKTQGKYMKNIWMKNH